MINKLQSYLLIAEEIKIVLVRLFASALKGMILPRDERVLVSCSSPDQEAGSALF